MKNSIVLVDEPLPKLCVFQSYLSMFLEALAQKKKKKYPKQSLKLYANIFNSTPTLVLCF